MKLFQKTAAGLLTLCFMGILFTGCAFEREGSKPATASLEESVQEQTTESAQEGTMESVQEQTTESAQESTAESRQEESAAPSTEVTSEVEKPLFTGRTAPVLKKAEAVTPTAGTFHVSRAFSDDMILQRDDYIRIWGTAPGEDGNTICAEFKGLKGSAVVKDGRWLITLDGTLEASAEQGHSLRVYGASSETVFENVLVGDVYLCIGQSNAAYMVANYLEDARDDDLYNKDFTQSDISNSDPIRIIRNVMGDPTVGKDITSSVAEDVMHHRGWQKPESAAMGTSAVGYFFAKQIVERTDNEIPIGIIECDAAGFQLSAFLSAETAEKCGADKYIEERGGYYGDSVNGLQRSRFLFNQYISPFLNFTVSGMIWYQGESDAPRNLPELYPERFAVMVQNYRDKIDQNYHDFPVYIMELTTEYAKPDQVAGDDWAYIDVGRIRSYMGNIPSLVPNTFIAVSSDLWRNRQYLNQLHPYCKWPMAERAVEIAMPILYRSYTDEELQNTGAPTYGACLSASDNEVVLQFLFTGGGLQTSGGGEAVGFEVLSEDGGWKMPEGVVLSGDTVTVTDSEMICGVRYCGKTGSCYPEKVNVCSGTGVPMAAFCWIAQ